MSNRRAFIILFLSSAIAAAQGGKTTAAPTLEAPVTLPIVFANTISAENARPGDRVLARTSQRVRLADGAVIPSGSEVSGQVVAAAPFVYDKTPYAHQKESTLSIRFEAVQIGTASVRLNVTVRAMADPLTSWGAREPKSSDLDPLSTVTQIGGDQLTPSQSEVVSTQGNVVAYDRHGDVYAHLIANRECDASSVEVSTDIYSASACGLYGFATVSAQERGSVTNPSILTLSSTHLSPKVWKRSTALLEVLPNPGSLASR